MGDSLMNIFGEAARAFRFLEAGVVGMIEDFRLRVESLQFGSGATISGALYGSKTWNIASTADNGVAETTLTVSGATFSHKCIGASVDSLTSAWTFDCGVSAANTVYVRALNRSGGTSDPASGTLSVILMQAS